MRAIFAQALWQSFCAGPLANCEKTKASLREALFEKAEIGRHLLSNKTAIDPNLKSCDPLFRDSANKIQELLMDLEDPVARLHSEDRLADLLKHIQNSPKALRMPDIVGQVIERAYQQFFILISEFIEAYPEQPGSYRLKKSSWDSHYHTTDQIKAAYSQLLGDLNAIIRQAGAASITQWSSFEEICYRIENKQFDYGEEGVSIWLTQQGIKLPVISEIEACHDLFKAYKTLRDSREQILLIFDSYADLKRELNILLGEGHFFMFQPQSEAFLRVVSAYPIAAAKVQEAVNLLKDWQNSVLLFRDMIRVSGEFFSSCEPGRLSPPALVEWISKKGAESFEDRDLRENVERQIRLKFHARLKEQDPLGLVLQEPICSEIKLPTTTIRPVSRLLLFSNSPTSRFKIDGKYQNAEDSFLSLNKIILGFDNNQPPELSTEIADKVCEIIRQQHNSLSPISTNPELLKLNSLLEKAYPAWQEIQEALRGRNITLLCKIDGLSQVPIEAQLCEWIQGIDQLQALLRTMPQSYSATRVIEWLTALSPRLEISHLCRSASILAIVATVRTHSYKKTENARNLTADFLNLDLNKTSTDQHVLLMHRDALNGLLFSLSIAGQQRLLSLAKQELILIDLPCEEAITLLNSTEISELKPALIAAKNQSGRRLTLSKLDFKKLFQD